MAGVVGLVVLLSGCNLFVQNYEDVDELCKKIVAGWKAQAEVVDASYVYVHGIDSGQQIDLDVIVRTESPTAEVLERLEDIANRDYWLSTAYDREDHMSFQYVVYSSDTRRQGWSGSGQVDRPGRYRCVTESRVGEVRTTTDDEVSGR